MTPSPTDRPTVRLNSDTPPTSDPSLQPATTLPPYTAGARPRGRASRLYTRLGERDLSVLRSLALLRLLTGAQLQRLHIADGSGLTRARRSRAVLRRLTELGVITRLPRRIGGIAAGSDGHIYALTGLGLSVLGIDGPHGGTRRGPQPIKTAFQDHLLGVAEVYVGLHEHDRVGDIELLAFETEPPCWRRFAGDGGQSVTLKPDAYLRLGVGDVELSCFLEQDQGTESPDTVLRKCQRYVQYYRAGHEQHDHGVFPRVWWLVPGATRAASLHRLLRRLPDPDRDLFRVAHHDQAVTTIINPQETPMP